MGARIRPLADRERADASAWIRRRWGDEVMAAHGELFRPADHDGYVAGHWEGLVTFRIDGRACEITLIEADPEGRGTGTALLEAACEAARRAGCDRVWLTTTNDNLGARAWYERRGFHVVAVREGAVDESRRTVKPSIPRVNETNGLPIRDEIDLEMRL